MKVLDLSVFNPNPSGQSEINASAVQVQIILSEFKCQVRMTTSDMRAQICPLPLVVDVETNEGGGSPYANHLTTGRWLCGSVKTDAPQSRRVTENHLYFFRFRRHGGLKTPFKSITSACLTIGMREETNQKVLDGECWRLPETRRSIVHRFPLLFLPSRNAIHQP